MAKGRASSPEAEAERRRKISEGRAHRKATLGYLNSDEARRRMASAKLGGVRTDEARAKTSAALKGRPPANLERFLAAAHAAPKRRGSEHQSWKGDAVSYGPLHSWVVRELGSPTVCEHCGKGPPTKMEWANKSGEYHRDLSDWLRLCRSCHRKYDHKLKAR